MPLEVFPIINCADVTGTAAWYRRVLSATLSYAFPDETEPQFVVLHVGAGQIGLGDGNAPALYGERPLPASGHPVDICLYVADLDRVVAADQDAVVVQPADMPWGERVAYLRDPAGTMLLVIQEPDRSAVPE